MRKFLIIAAACAIGIVAATDALAAKRKHVRISKPSQPVAQQVPLAAVPVIAVAFDIARRTSCDPAVAVSTGPGDPGFDPNGPKVGNFLLPAINSRCASRPQPKRRS
jgi:hypothetical protein